MASTALLLIASLLAADPPRIVSSAQLAIKGVAVGTLQSEVIAKLGRPPLTKRGYDDTMGTGHWQKLHYRGLMVEVIKPDPGMLVDPPSEAHVSRVVLSGAKWVTACGIRIGMGPAQTAKILGPPESTEQEGGELRHWYHTAGFDGQVLLRFREDKLVELTIEEDWS